MALAYAALVATGLSSARRNQYDVVVVGAGPGGCVAALSCARAGMRTLIVERSRMPRAKLCGGCLAPAGVGVLRRFGVDSVLADCGAVPLTSLRLVAGGASCDLQIRPYLGIARSALDEALVGALDARGIDRIEGVSARVLPDDRVSLRLDEGTATLSPAAVIVADGLHGRTLSQRPEFDWRVDRGSPVGYGTVVRTPPGPGRAGSITMLCGREGYVGVAPLGYGPGQTRWAMSAALRPGAVRNLGAGGAVDALLEGCGEVVPAGAREARWMGVGPLTRHRRTIGLGRVLVTGDAAGYVQPITGEGMSWAMVGAADIGRFAARISRGEDVGAAWGGHVRRLLRRRRAVCRAVCGVTATPWLLRPLVHVLDAAPLGKRLGRELCWRAA